MKLVFIHSHKFRLINGKFYSLGGLSDEVFERYSNYVDEIIVVARVVKEKEGNSRYSEIKNPKLKILNIKDIGLKGLRKQIMTSDYVIARIPSFLSYIGIITAKKYKKECLLEVVGCAFDSLWNHGILGKVLAFPMLILMKRLVKHAQYVLYVSEKFLQKRYPTTGKAIGCSDVIIENIEKDTLERRIRKIKEKKQEKIIIGTIAAVNVKYKGQQYIIKAISDLKQKGINIEYQLVGSGENKYLKDKANKLKVDENVKFLGSLPHGEIFKWIDEIDIYAQPSNTEGLCRALVEAMSRACPCIVSNAGGNVELIEKPYIFKKKNIKEIKNKIQSIEKEEMIQMAETNYEKAKQYEKKILSQRRDDFYRQFLKVKEESGEKNITNCKSNE